MTAQPQSEVLFGPAGWSYEDWQGVVYPKPLPTGFNHLDFLARELDFVEVNTTFYRIPGERLVQGWVRKTHHLDRFAFWIKLYQGFTHQRILDESEARQFGRSLKPLADAGKLLGLLAQFPYSFHCSEENLEYIKSTAALFPGWPLAVEFRHASWNREEVLARFRKESWLFVNIDQPPVSASLPLTGHVTHPEMAYLRLHGRNAQSWFSGEGRDARYDYLYTHGELEGIAAIIRRLKEEAKKIFVSGNNHYKGSAIRNLLQLKEMVHSQPK